MISDVLFDALEEVERYQRQFPDAYGEKVLADKIEAVKAAMRSLLNELDTPPTADEMAAYEREHQEALEHARRQAAMLHALTDALARAQAGNKGDKT